MIKTKKHIRQDLISKVCDRCGNDLMTGTYIIHLIHKNLYITLCGVCCVGLGIKPELIQNAEHTQEQWNKFWKELI